MRDRKTGQKRNSLSLDNQCTFNCVWQQLSADSKSEEKVHILSFPQFTNARGVDKILPKTRNTVKCKNANILCQEKHETDHRKEHREMLINVTCAESNA